MHDDLQRAGRRRLVLTAVAGVALLTTSLALLVFPLVAACVVVFAAAFGETSVGHDLVRSIWLSLAIAFVTAVVSAALSWRNAERDALRTTDLQLATVPGARIDVVPSWRVSGEALPRVRTLLTAVGTAMIYGTLWTSISLAVTLWVSRSR